MSSQPTAIRRFADWSTEQDLTTHGLGFAAPPANNVEGALHEGLRRLHASTHQTSFCSRQKSHPTVVRVPSLRRRIRRSSRDGGRSSSPCVQRHLSLPISCVRCSDVTIARRLIANRSTRLEDSRRRRLLFLAAVAAGRGKCRLTILPEPQLTMATC